MLQQHALDAIDLTDPPIPSSSNQDLIRWCREGLRAVRRQGHSCSSGRSRHTHCTDKSTDTRGSKRADTLAELGRRADRAYHLSIDSSFSSQSAVSTTVPELAAFRTRLTGWSDIWYRPSLARYNLVVDFLPGVASLLTTLPSTPMTATMTRTERPDAVCNDPPDPRWVSSNTESGWYHGPTCMQQDETGRRTLWTLSDPRGGND